MADETVDLMELLSKPMSEYPDLPNLPSRKTFYGKLLSIAATHSSNKGTPAFHFDVRLTDPGPDVDKATLDALAAQGFSLSDFPVGADFWLTPKSMVMLRRFLQTLGLDPSKSMKENLKLADDGTPTAESQDIVRGLDVVIRTPTPGENGVVYTNSITSNGGAIAGKAS